MLSHTRSSAASRSACLRALLAVTCASWTCCLAIPAAAQELRPVPPDTLPRNLVLDQVPVGITSPPPAPPGNEITAARVALGRRLFFDPLLSVDKTAACASCHDPKHGFATADRVAIGVANALGTRNTPSVLNRAYGRSFFWDGRSPSLEDQALQPISNPKELATSVETVIQRLQEDAAYRDQFAAAYEGGITAENLARAIASFERVLISGNSAVDRFRAGEFAALTDSQRQGLWLFESRGGCWKCHSGDNLSDEKFHNTGVSWGKQPLDLGRFQVTSEDRDRGGFRTPPLRDVALTAPYMHDGSLKTLADVVEFYNRGGTPNPHLDTALKPLNLSAADKAHLVDFLQALTGSQKWSAD